MSIKYRAMKIKYYAIFGTGIGIVLNVIAFVAFGGDNWSTILLLLFFAPLASIFPIETLMGGGVLLYIGYAVLLGWGNNGNNGRKILLIFLLFHFGAVALSIWFYPKAWDYDGLSKAFMGNQLFTICSFVPFVLTFFLTVCDALKPRKIEDGIPFCGKCHYNLTGNTSGVCPECGEEIKNDLSEGLPA